MWYLFIWRCEEKSLQMTCFFFAYFWAVVLDLDFDFVNVNDVNCHLYTFKKQGQKWRNETFLMDGWVQSHINLCFMYLAILSNPWVRRQKQLCVSSYINKVTLNFGQQHYITMPQIPASKLKHENYKSLANIHYYIFIVKKSLTNRFLQKIYKGYSNSYLKFH